MFFRGAAGVGKSCLAGRLIDRLPGRALLVFHGVLKKADILQKSIDLFDRIGLDSGLHILRSDLEYADKIKALFRKPFQEKSCLIYFDDFEQNLYRDGDRYYVSKEMIEAITPFLTALDWALGNTQLMITSRYPFVLEIGGRNLPEQILEDIPLMSFHGPDLLLYRECLGLHRRVAVRIDEQVVEEARREKDGTVAVLFNELGVVLKNLGESGKALDFYNKALAIDLEVFGDRHPDVARDYNNLGAAWHDLGDAQQAIDFYNKALAILTAVYGPDHPSTRIVEASINALKEPREKSTK